MSAVGIRFEQNGAEAAAAAELAQAAGEAAETAAASSAADAAASASTVGGFNTRLSFLEARLFDVTDPDYGAVGDGVTDDLPAIEAAFTAAAAVATADAQATVLIPPSTSPYVCNGIVYPPSNVRLIIMGTIKFTGGNTMGSFVHVRNESNVEICGIGTIDANSQGNNNGVAISNGDTTGQRSKNIRVHGVTIKNSTHGGDHIVDATDPAFVGTGGGKGITVQFGCEDVHVSDVLIEDCDIGFSIEGKQANDGDVVGITFADVTVRNARYAGAFLFGSLGGTLGSLQQVSLTGVSFYDCAAGQTSEAVPQDIADLFGVISCQIATNVTGKAIKIVNSAGTITPIRGAHRLCDWDVHVVCAGLTDAVNSAPWGGHNPQLTPSRYNQTRMAVVINGATFSGYLVNMDATYPAERSTFDLAVAHDNANAPLAVPLAQYVANQATTAAIRVRDHYDGRTTEVTDGASPTLDVAGFDHWINGLALSDDAGNDLTKLTPGRSSLALTDDAGTSKLQISADGVQVRSPLVLRPTTLTIAGGAVTVTGPYHRIDTEAAAATDNLDNIAGAVADGQLVILSTVNDGRDVVVTHAGGGGNIRLNGAANLTLTNTGARLTLMYDSVFSRWYEVSRSIV